MQEVAFHSYSIKNCKAKNILSSGSQHQNTWRPDHPNRLSSSQIKPACKQLLGCRRLCSLVQTGAGVPGSENQAEMLCVLGKAWSQRKDSLRCPQKTMRKVGNALKVAQPMQNSLSSRVSHRLSEYNPFLQTPE